MFVRVELRQINTCVDDNLVTAAAWPGHPGWICKFLEVLGTRIEP